MAISILLPILAGFPGDSLTNQATAEFVEAPVFAPAEANAPPIRLWLNSSRQFREGERARVQVETNDDGYLLVLNYDTDGRVRVLFPVDPREDPFVRGGRRYEVRGRADRESFVVGRSGDGMVFAAVSADPFRIEEWDAAGNWDYSRLYIPEDSRDPEADLSDLVQRITSSRGFDYDLLEYRVYGDRGYDVAHSGWYPRPYGYWDDYYCDYWYRPSLFGCRMYPVGGWYYGWGGYYRGWRYGGGYYPWYRYPTYYNPNYRYPVVVGRPRGYTIVRRPVGANDGRGRGGVWSGALPRGLGNESPVGYRPRGGNAGRGRPDGDRVTPGRGADRPVGGDNASRPRGRRSPVENRDETPNMERDPGSRRGPVDIGSGRRVRGGSDDGPRVERPAPRNNDDRPAARPSQDRPSGERPRSVDRPRSEPRQGPPPPRAEPRRESPPSARPSGGGNGGGRRPRGGDRPG